MGSAAAAMAAHLAAHPEGVTLEELAAATGATLANAQQFLYRETRAGRAAKRPATWRAITQGSDHGSGKDG